MDTDYTWFVYNGRLLYSMHRTWADAMRSVAKAQRTITVTLPPYSDRYTTECVGRQFPLEVVDVFGSGSPSIRCIGDDFGIGIHPGELEPVALALLAIDKHNKEQA